MRVLFSFTTNNAVNAFLVIDVYLCLTVVSGNIAQWALMVIFMVLDTPSTFSHNSERDKEIGQVAASMYNQVGIEGALGFLYAHFCTIFSLSSMQCITYSLKERTTSNMASIGLFLNKAEQRISLMGDAPSDDLLSFLENDLHAISFINDITMPAYYANTYKAAFLSVRSVAKLPLCAQGHLVCQLSLYSEHPHTFHDEGIKRISNMCEELGGVLQMSVLGRFLRPDEKVISVVELMRQNPAMAVLMKKVERVALTDTTVLITGETGTGKSMMAEAIHELSARKDKPFVTVNCGSMPESLVDSLLFGHERGAFTGAVTTTKGFFEQASGGTLFFDEVGELPFTAQVKFLSVLDKPYIQKVGSAQKNVVDVRIIAATNQNLEELVMEKKFREDLFYRLNVYALDVPPLRERKADIPPIIQNLLKEKCMRLQIPRIPTIPPEAIKRLSEYPWPGNVRQLEHVIESALVDFKASDRKQMDLHLTMPPKLKEKLRATANLLPTLSGAFPSLEEMTKQHIKLAFEYCNGRVAGKDGAAALLGIHRSTLYKYLKEIGLVEQGESA